MGIAAYNRGSRAISAYIDQRLRESREVVPTIRERRLPPWHGRLVEEVFQALVDDNNRREAYGLPTFEPSYELAEKIVLKDRRQ